MSLRLLRLENPSGLDSYPCNMHNADFPSFANQVILLKCRHSQLAQSMIASLRCTRVHSITAFRAHIAFELFPGYAHYESEMGYCATVGPNSYKGF